MEDATTRSVQSTPTPTHESATPAPAVSLKHSFYPRLLGPALLQAAKLRVRLWDRAVERIELVQRRQLQRILDHAASTEFGRRFGFSSIGRYEDFAQRVPVGDYDAFSPFIERMRRGERNLLVPEFVRYYGNSSGSSTQGKSKFLPITERQIALQKGSGADTLMRYLAWAKEDSFTRGFTLGLFPPTTMKEEGPVLITSNPALMVTRMPLFTRPIYLPDAECRAMVDYDRKLEAIAERYLDYDVRAVTGTTCWFPLMFEKLLEVAKRRGRAARAVRDLWPNLRVLIGGGVSAAPYLPVLKRLVGRDDFTLVDTYNATEGGIYAASDFSGRPGMLMLPQCGAFFEFVPLEEVDAANPTRVPLWRVERNRNYAIVVTTVSGLYAYKLGDIVRFPETSPPRIEFVGRLTGCLSLTQELTTHVEIERAVAHAVERCPCVTEDFGAAGEVGVGGAKGRYLLFVEFREGAQPADLVAFARAFDEGLSAQNRVYREHRTNEVALLSPRVLPLVPHGARRFMDAVTGGNMQGKFPRIVGDERLMLLRSFARSEQS